MVRMYPENFKSDGKRGSYSTNNAIAVYKKYYVFFSSRCDKDFYKEAQMKR